MHLLDLLCSVLCLRPAGATAAGRGLSGAPHHGGGGGNEGRDAASPVARRHPRQGQQESARRWPPRFGAAFSKLYAEGGIPRFYNGFWAAIIVGPLSRFGDTAANEGILALCEGVLPTAISTMLASAGAACWRIMTQPVQNVKTLMQVEGAAG
eukprot:COSAG01_NODE_35401_length_532_cov_1.233256_1_plen_152_part_01